MKNLGTLLAVLSLVAMAPSNVYAKKTSQLKAIQEESALRSSAVFNAATKNRWISFVNNQKGSDVPDAFRGGFLNPYQTIGEAVVNTKQGGIIYVINTGTPYQLAEPLVLKNRQALIGSSIGIKVQGLTVPASTPGKRPVIKIGGLDEMTTTASGGIVVSKGNRVSGFQIVGNGNGVAIAGEVESSCSIDKNQFSELDLAITLGIESGARVDICDNKFLAVGTSLSFNPGNGRIVTNICRNTFDASTITTEGYDYDTAPTLQIGAVDKSKLQLASQNLSRQLTSEAISVEQLSDEIAAEDVTNTTLFFSNLDVFLFNNTYKGFTTQIGLSGNSKLIAQGNKFSQFLSPNSGALDVALSNGANGLFKENSFFQNFAGLRVVLSNGGIATVTDNSFSDNSFVGFEGGSDGAQVGVFNCLQLLGNRAKNKAYDYGLVNTSSPVSFKANIRGNVGSVYVPSAPVTFTNSCPGCLKFR